MAYLTQFSVPTLLNPMINKMADEASAILLLICSHEAWGKVAYTGPRPCAYACAYVDPVFTCQSYDMGISTRRTNFVVRFFLCLCLCFMSTQFSLAYTCACAYAYAYALVKTRLIIMITSRPRIFLSLVFTST